MDILKFNTIYFSLVRHKGTHNKALEVEGRSHKKKSDQAFSKSV